MPIILIILQIISAIPTLIKIVKEILDLINGMPKSMQHDAAAELKQILQMPKGNNRLQLLADFKARVRSSSKAK